MNEVSFNAVLLKELEMMALVRRGVHTTEAEAKHWAEMRIHLVRSDMLTNLGASSKLNAEWAFLTMLRDEGRRAGEEFLAEDGSALGKTSTLDIDRLRDGIYRHGPVVRYLNVAQQGVEALGHGARRCVCCTARHVRLR